MTLYLYVRNDSTDEDSDIFIAMLGLPNAPFITYQERSGSASTILYEIGMNKNASRPS